MARVKLSPVQTGLLAVGILLLLGAIIGLSVFFSKPAHRSVSTSSAIPAAIPQRNPQRNPRRDNRSTEYAFDVNENLRYCGRRTERVQLTPGTKDYSAKFDKAAERLSKAGGGTLALDEGVYLMSRQFYVPSHVCVRGRGMTRTTLRMVPRSARWIQAGMVRVQNATRVSLIDFTADGANDTQLHGKKDTYGRYGLYATSFSHLWIRGVRMINHYSYGFDPHGTRDTWSHYLVMEGCVAERNGLDGFTLDQTRHISLLDSVARNNYRHGVNIVTGSADVLVRRIVTENNGVYPMGKDVGCGIIVQNNEEELQTRDCILDANTLVDSPRGGVCISDSINVTISNTNTTIKSFPNAPCYLFRNSKQVVISNSTCTATSMRRVSVDQMSKYVDDGVKNNGLPVPRVAGNFPVGDANCTNGIRNKDVCCPIECGQCGGEGCGRAPVDALCCTKNIISSKVPCGIAPAPCVLSAAYFSPTPHVHISFFPAADAVVVPDDVMVNLMPSATALAVAETM